MLTFRYVVKYYGHCEVTEITGAAAEINIQPHRVTFLSEAAEAGFLANKRESFIELAKYIETKEYLEL